MGASGELRAPGAPRLGCSRGRTPSAAPRRGRRGGRAHRRRGSGLGGAGRRRAGLPSPARSSPRRGGTSSWATSRPAGAAAVGARRRGAGGDRRTRPAGRSSAGPASCSTCCWPRPGCPRARRAVLNVVKCRPPGNRTPKARRGGPVQRLAAPAARAARRRPWSSRSGCRRRKWFLGPRTVLGAGPRAARTAVDGRAGLGDVPPVGRDPVRPERGAAGGAARPTSTAVAAVAGRARERVSTCCRRRRTPGARPRAGRRCCGAGDLVVLVGPLGRRQDRADPGHRRRARRRAEPVTSPTFVIARVHPAAGCRWCTSTPTGSAASPTWTTWTWTPRPTSR